MRCPSIHELPAPPSGKTGWPWTEESQQLPDRMPDGSEWPKISIVTPNYNYERYLETTIRSVLLQGYPNVEFIIQDDGSTDGSVDLIRRYEKHLAYWSSDPNSGQPSVINRGLHRSSGSILAYINSDDYYAADAFGIAAQYFHQHPEVDFINGRCRYVDESEVQVGEQFGDITRLDEVLDLWNVWWNRANSCSRRPFGDGQSGKKSVTSGPICISSSTGSIGAGCFLRVPWRSGWMPTLPASGISRVKRPKTHSCTSDEELQILKGWLWNSEIPLDLKKRQELQSLWLYDCKFRKTADASIQRHESHWKRWSTLAWMAVRHPQLFRVQEFRRRLFGRVLPL